MQQSQIEMGIQQWHAPFKTESGLDLFFSLVIQTLLEVKRTQLTVLGWGFWIQGDSRF